MPRKKKEKTKKLTVHLQHPALEKLKEDLSSPRLAPIGTIKTYTGTAERFLLFAQTEKPTDSDFRQYFIWRREQGISEKTLRKEFYQLQRLVLANKWEKNWPFTSKHVPLVTEEEEDKLLPSLRAEQVESLIRARERYSDIERFYLAIATTWIVRREDLARIKKRDIYDTTLVIHHSKRGKTVKHLIPEALHQVFDDYHPREHQPEPLSRVFQRICAKAGIERPSGMGWHGIRYCLTTMLNTALAKNNLSPVLLAQYAGWKKKSMAHLYGGVEMAAVYQRPEILYSDPFGLDRVIYQIHPFLSLWEKKAAPAAKKRKKQRS
jgi:integrase